MGLIALLFSVVADAIWPLQGRVRRIPTDDLDLEDDTAGAVDRPSAPHPLQRPALRLIDRMSAEPVDPLESGRLPSSRLPPGRQLSAPGWIVVVGLPVLLVALAQSLLGALAGFFEFALHVFVLYLTVGVGAFHRQFLELQLLIGAGEDRSARTVLGRWIRSGGSREGATAVDADDAADLANVAIDGTAGPEATGAVAQGLPRAATAEAVLAAYRDVFAPLFWYAILPGATGPVLYLFARFAACHSHPFARTAYYWLDWLPLRVASMGLALAGQFEEAVFSLRAVNGARTEVAASADPYIHQRLLLLPVAGGALGLRLTDANLEARLRLQAPELDFPTADPEPPSLRPVAGLLLRSSVIWVGLYLLVKVLG